MVFYLWTEQRWYTICGQSKDGIQSVARGKMVFYLWIEQRWYAFYGKLSVDRAKMACFLWKEQRWYAFYGKSKDGMLSVDRTAVQLSAGVKREILSPAKVRLTFAWGFPYEAFNANGKIIV